MKRFLVVISLFICTTPHLLACSSEGYSVVFVNGVLVSNEDFGKNMESLKSLLPDNINGQKIHLISGYNPTNLWGLDDIFDVVIQKEIREKLDGNTTNLNGDPDFEQMLYDISQKVTSGKLLIVAHSQGNLYANAIRERIVSDGFLPTNSVAVYSIGTPAEYVSGNGKYITTSKDRVIVGMVRDLLRYDIKEPNASFQGDDYLSHGFISTYSNYAADQITTDITQALTQLSNNTASTDECLMYEAPAKDTTPESLGRSINSTTAALSLIGVRTTISAAEQFAYLTSRNLMYTYTLSQSLGKTVGVGLSSLAYNIIDTGYSASKVALNSFVSGISLVGTFNANTYYFVTDNITALVKLFENSSNQGAAVATSGAEQVTTPLTSPVILDIKDTPGILSNVIITPVPLVVEEVVSPSQTPLEPTPEPLPTTQILETEVLPSTEVISVPVAPLTTDTAPLIQTGGSGLTGSQLSAALLPLTFTVDTDTARIYGRSEILLKGTSTAGVQIDIPYGQNTITVTADEEGKWEYLYTFPRGTTTISLHAYKEGYVSSATSVTITSLPGTREPSIAGRYNKAESPYLLERLVTSSEYATVVEPGTVIKFIPSLTNGIYAGCPFYCTGATEHLTVGEPNGEPVIFTTSTDDSILGDTNDDGSATVPVPNSYSWNQGFFADTDMYHTDMRYASLHLYGGDLLLSDYIAAGRGEGITTSYEPGNPPSLTISDTTFVKANIYQHSGTLTLRNVAFTESETLPRARIGNSGTLYLNDVTCDAAFDTCLEGGWNGPLEQIVYSSQIASTPLVFTTPFYIPAAGAIFGGPVSLIGTRDTPLYIHILGSLFPDTPVSSPSLVEQFVIYVNELGEEMRRGWE